MPHIKSKYFPVLLLTSSIVVEVCAIFFSVYGLSKLFAGAAIAVSIMAGSLELAKVVSVSYLYRYWDEINKLFRAYMTSAVVILMLITSLGIYGFLSNAFQGSTLILEKDIAKLTLQEDEIIRIKEDNNSLKNEKEDLRNSMNTELSGLVIKEESRYVDVNKRTSVSRRYQVLIKEKDKQLTENSKKIEKLSQEITDSKVKMIDTGADVGPIIFVSRSFGVDVSTVVQYLILLFIVVFDPLALALIIAFNKISIDNYEVDYTTKLKSNASIIVPDNIEVNIKPKEEIVVPHANTPVIKAKQKEPIPIAIEVIEPPKQVISDIKNMAQKYGTDEESIVYVDTSKEQTHKASPRETSTFW